jgi:hypothetical protein
MKKFKDFINEKNSSAEVSEYEFDFGGNSFMIDADVEGAIDFNNRDQAPEDWMRGMDLVDVDKISISKLYAAVLDDYVEINSKNDPKVYKTIAKKLEVYLMKDKNFIEKAEEAIYNSNS